MVLTSCPKDNRALLARLRVLKTAHEDDVTRAVSLKCWITGLLEKHASKVSAFFSGSARSTYVMAQVDALS